MGFGWHGHGVVGGAFVADQLDEQRLHGVSGDDDGTVVATFQQACAGGHAEAAAMVCAAVAAIAVGLEDGLHALGIEGCGVGCGVGLCGDGMGLPEESGGCERCGCEAECGGGAVEG